MQVNRKGFTAIIDAGFFIVLLGIAVLLLSQAGVSSEENNIQDISESCDIIFESKVKSTEFGFEGDERIMALCDLTAASLSLEDGNAKAYLEELLNELYPWNDAYGMQLTYGEHTAEINPALTGNQIVKRSYTVAFGGTLEVWLTLNV